MKVKNEKLIGINFPKGLDYTNKRLNLLLPQRRHAPGSDRCIIVDGMNLAYQSFYAYSKLSYKGKSTSILYGFVNILRPIIEQYNPAKVIVCWDGEKHPERMRMVPGYKAHREEKRDLKKHAKFHKQIAKTRKLLYLMGIPQAWNGDVEGDDMIYMLTQRMVTMYRVLIVSADKDFKQLINHDVDVYNPRGKSIENAWAFNASNYGVELPQYLDFLCMTGDSSDDIPGMPGIAEGRASGLLKRYYTFKQYLESPALETGFMDKDKFAKIYKRNKRMIGLKLFHKLFNKGAKILYYKDTQNPKFQEELLKEYCNSFNMKTLVFPRFLHPFKKLCDD